MHDWGGYSRWIQEGVDHALRSVWVAETFLRERECPPDLLDLVLECIRLHHVGGPNRSIESVLLSDADALDFLGVVGVLRDFSKNTKDLRKAYEISKGRRDKLPDILCMDRSKKIAAERLEEMDELLTNFERDSWGHF